MNLVLLRYMRYIWRSIRCPWAERSLEKRYPNSIFYEGVVVDAGSKLGRYNVLFGNVTLCQSTLGDHSYVQKNSNITNSHIGKFCSIAANVSIGLGQHPINHVSTHPAFFSKNQPLAKTFSNEDRCSISSTIQIGHDVWIGNSAMIMDGVKIGNGSIIAAGAVVIKDVEPYAIVGGVPAAFIKYRFPEDVRINLNTIKWWDQTDEWLMKYNSLFSSPSVLLKTLYEHDVDKDNNK